MEKGTKIKLEVWNYKLKESEWHEGEITAKVSATDRDYRYHVKLNDGREFNECAPECIKVK